MALMEYLLIFPRLRVHEIFIIIGNQLMGKSLVMRSLFKSNCIPFRERVLRNILIYVLPTVVAQSYEVEADNEYVIRGNSAIMKCEIPSFVSDFVTVENWQDSKGNTYLPGSSDGNFDRSKISHCFFLVISIQLKRLLCPQLCSNSTKAASSTSSFCEETPPFWSVWFLVLSPISSK